MVALSSAAVYSGEPPFHESSPTGAGNAYAASKLAMELYCDQYAKWAGLPVSVLRCFNLTGPGEPPSQATSEFVLAALGADRGVATVEVGDPEIARDFTDVRDAARAVAAVLEAGAGGTYNLCSGVSVSLARLAETIGGLTGVSLRLRAAGSRAASGLATIRGDNSLLGEATGWRPVISLEQSLTSLVESRR
jgi:nucleoside-diphosphate-sugar epimerase